MNKKTIRGIIYGVITYLAASFVLDLIGTANVIARVVVVSIIMLGAMALIQKINK